jgi:predicted transglutaminase-like cysteine proteinase
MARTLGPVLAVLAFAGSPAQASDAPGTPPVMAVGAWTPAPRGFLDLCARAPDNCRIGDEDLATLQTQRAQANRRYYEALFGRPLGGPLPRPGAPAAGEEAAEAKRADPGIGETAAVQPVGAHLPADIALTRPPAGAVEVPSAPTASLFGLPWATLTDLGLTPGVGWSAVVSAPKADLRGTADEPQAGDALAAADVSGQDGTVADFRPDAALSVEDLLPSVEGPRDVAVVSAQIQGEGSGVIADRAATASEAPEVQNLEGGGYVLDQDGWRLVNGINRRINRAIRHVDDDRLYGVADYWARPENSGLGDCEDFVLAKRAALIQAGVPATALSIAIVVTRWGESHAVLLLASEEGEYVLDSLSPWIARWDRVDYLWRERQRAGRPFDWVMAGV